MKNQIYVRICLAGLLILLLFITATSGAEQTFLPTLGATTPSVTPTLGPTPPTTMPTLGTTTPPGTVGGNGIPLNPVIGVVALAVTGFLVLLHKRK